MVDFFRKVPLLCVSKANCFPMNAWQLEGEVHFLLALSRIQGWPPITFRSSTAKVLANVAIFFYLNN